MTSAKASLTCHSQKSFWLSRVGRVKSAWSLTVVKKPAHLSSHCNERVPKGSILPDPGSNLIFRRLASVMACSLVSASSAVFAFFAHAAA
jgi:hypothetical protein